MISEKTISKMAEYFSQSVVRSALSAWESGYLKMSKQPGEKLSIQEAAKFLFTLIVCKPQTVLECISTLNAINIDDAFKPGNESKMLMIRLQAALSMHLAGAVLPLSKIKELRFGYKSTCNTTVFEDGVVVVGDLDDPTQIILPGDFLRWFVKNFVA